MTEEDQDYLRTENRTGDYINDVLRDLPDDFQTYVKRKKLHCRHWIYIPLGNYGLYVGRVFWSREDEQCERHPAPCSQLIDSIANPEIIEKIKSLLRKLELPGNILVQFWKAVESGGRRLLTTRDQPFCLAASKFLPLPYMTYERLCSHRLISLDYDFFLDGGESEEEDQLGLPGRVFLNQQLESTPNVSYYSSKEYPPRDRTNTSSCLALPVFEPSGRCCVGVLEIVNDDSFYTPKHKYEICRALEDVGLKCLETCNHLYGQNKDKVKALEGALVEIRKGLKVVCETHDLPLAQIWVWCRLCNAAFYYCSFNSSAYVEYQREIHMNYFIEACNLHPLRKGEGVVGKAFLSRNLVFCKDITQFRITEYRLAHYARKYGLNGCLAICLRSSDIGDDLYVIEFFLPPSNMKGGDPRTTMAPIFATMRQHFQSFKVASGEELGEELSIEVIGFSKDDKLDSFLKPQTTRSPDRPKTLENGGETVLLDSSDRQFIVADAGNNVVGTAENSNIAITSSQQKCVIKLSRRKHRNAGIQISLEDVQKQSGKKLDDAAESLGFSRSTLKPVCREYEIYWWQPRKRNKDNQSLPNEPVQGATQEQIQDCSQPPNDNHSLPNKSVQDFAREQIQDSSQPPISDPPCKKNRTTVFGTKLHPNAVQDISNVIVKAKYGGYFIRYELPMSSGIEEFQQQVAMRLPKLKGGTYSITYQDDENDWILIALDKDLQDYISYSRSLGKSTAKMVLQPVTN